MIKISPSLLSADFSNLGFDVRRVTEAGADLIHCDIMDGRFVPNITFGPLVIRDIRDKTDLPLMCHLMIEQPESIMAEFIKAGADGIIVHAEATLHLNRAIQQIKELGAKPGVAINPATPLCMVENVIGDIDELLVMTVNPGFGGQKFLESTLVKISDARKMADATDRDIDIGVDGGINLETCPKVVQAGANVIIAGNYVFTYPEGAQPAIAKLREVCCSK
jgi:ribulose-phosphate 3-epimerase